VGDAGRLYRTEDEAVALVQASGIWTDAQWDDAERRSRERAVAFDDRTVLRPMLDDWRALAAGTMGERARRRRSPIAVLRGLIGA
jgi:hypothetical protein